MLVPEEYLWMVIVGFIVAFILAFGIGANDVANSFGTSVGAKVVKLWQACVLATIFEIAGAILIGARVSDTMRKGIVDVSAYNNSEKELLVGNVAALTGSCAWLMVATLLKLPVSATHSIVGATVGFSLVAQGSNGIGWAKLGFIVGSWFISPLLSGFISSVIFIFIRKVVLDKEKPLKPGLKLLPMFYCFTVFIIAFSVFYDGSQLLHFDKIPLYGVFILSVGLAVLTALAIQFILVPIQRKRLRELAENGDLLQSFEKPKSLEIQVVVEAPEKEKDAENGSPNGVDYTKSTESAHLVTSTSKPASSEADDSSSTIDSQEQQSKLEKKREAIKDNPAVAKLFSFLQILTAIFGSFAHGGNDVSNAIGPVVALWVVSTTGNVEQKAETPIWILFYGGVGISVGLWVLGRRVMKTMGEDLSKITPSSGFCIEVGSALTVLVASNVGIPISTTHCKVGSIVFVGRVRSNENVDWSLFRNIIIAWVVTLPASGLVAAGMMALLRLAI